MKNGGRHSTSQVVQKCACAPPWYSYQGSIVCIFSLFCSDRHCPTLGQPFTRRVLLDQHIQMMHGIRDQDGKNTNSDQSEASDDKKRVQLYSSHVDMSQFYFFLTDSFLYF